MTENEMVGWHHRLNAHEFEQALEDGEGQGSLLCSDPRGRRVSHNRTIKWKRLWKRIDTCICITESLYCPPETNTTLFINYTPT